MAPLSILGKQSLEDCAWPLVIPTGRIRIFFSLVRGRTGYIFLTTVTFGDRRELFIYAVSGL